MGPPQRGVHAHVHALPGGPSGRCPSRRTAALALTTAEPPAEIKLWDLNTGEVRASWNTRRRWPAPPSPTTAGSSSAAPTNRTVRVWDAATGQEVKCSEELGKRRLVGDARPDYRHVFVADMDGVTRMLETGTLRVVRGSTATGARTPAGWRCRPTASGC